MYVLSKGALMLERLHGGLVVSCNPVVGVSIWISRI
jgi:hypothetical protein